MKDLNYISNEISKGKNPEINLPKYANSMMSFYNGVSYIKLAMNYYTYYEMLTDMGRDNADLEGMKVLAKRLGKVIADEIINEENTSFPESGICEIDAIRNEIIHTMEIITAYTDRLRVYEYILNRVEYRFSEEAFDEDYYMNDLTNDIMNYILADNDNMVVNGKITEIVGQLPVRMSKDRFFEYLKDALSLYKGAQKGSVDDFIYALRTVSMLEIPDGIDESFVDVRDICRNLKEADYRNITKEEFKVLSDKLLVATQIISDTSDLFVTLVQLVNDVYTILLSKHYAFNDVEEVKNGRYVIKCINDGFEGKEYNSDDDRLMECFMTFEGEQEKIYSVISQNEHIIEFALKNESDLLNALVLDKIFNSLEIISKLQSGSDFIDLHEKTERLETADEEYVEEAFDKLVSEFREMFSTSPQIVNRAVMGAVLGQLPVFFNSVDEIQNYINTSLSQCTDIAERMAFAEIAEMILGSE